MKLLSLFCTHLLKRGLFFIILFFSNLSVADSHHPEAFLQSIRGAPNEGEQIVQHFCSSCHSPHPMIELGAPKIGEKKDWQPRLKKGVATLLNHTEEGINAMPARGGCFECSDEQLILALVAMLPEAMKKSFFEDLIAHKKYTE